MKKYGTNEQSSVTKPTNQEALEHIDDYCIVNHGSEHDIIIRTHNTSNQGKQDEAMGKHPEMININQIEDMDISDSEMSDQ